MSTGLVHPSGIDLDDLFEVTGTGTQRTNILCYNSQDIGNRYRAGTTNISDTGFRTASGVDVKNLFGGGGVGLYRPAGGAWNAGSSCTATSESGCIQFWTDYIECWKNRPRDVTNVSNVMNDCVYRDIHTRTVQTSVIWGYTPFRTNGINFTWREIASANNDGDTMFIWPFELDAYCKGIVFRGASGSGDWTMKIVQCSLTVDGFGTFNYEGLYRVNTDSNHPATGDSWSMDWNGKQYVYYGS